MNSLNNKALLLILTLVFAVMLCGAVSAATVKTSQINPVNTSSAGLHVDTLEETPDISGNIVVYTKTRQAGMDYLISSEIYYKHLVTRKGGRVSSQYGNFQFNPAISGTRVVWEQHISGHSYIYFKNFATGASGRVTSSTANQSNPDISGTMIVWLQNMGSHSNIYFKNLATGASGRVASSTFSQDNPSISGTRVVWTELTLEHTYVYVKNILTGRIARLGTNHAYTPDISGNKVVWAHWIGEGYAISWRDLVTGAGGNLNIKGSSNFPKISGSRVVWINDYYTEILGDLITVYEKNLVTGSLVTVNVQHGGGQYYPMAAISGVNVVWTAWNEGLYVYWKNVLTGTGGRVQPSSTTIYPKLIDSGVTTCYWFPGSKYYWKTYLYTNKIIIYSHFYNPNLKRQVYQTTTIKPNIVDGKRYGVLYEIIPKSDGKSAYVNVSGTFTGTTLQYYWTGIKSYYNYWNFRTYMIEYAPNH